MRIQFTKNRIVRTFFGYIVIILIPLGVLMYEGVSALQNHKLQIENNVYSRLRQVGEEFYRDLLMEWQTFLEGEKVRKFYHYQPLMAPEEDFFRTRGPAIQRSPLYETVEKLTNLYHIRDGSLQTADTFAPSLDQILNNSLIGYFQFNPHTRRFTSPYDDTPTFPTRPPETAAIQQYRTFLDDRLKHRLIDRLDLPANSDIKPASLLLHLKTKRITKTKEPFDKMMGATAPSRLEPDANGLMNVSYYDFSFFSFEEEGERYVVGVRPVVLGKQVLIQGFMFNLLLLIQEGQGYLEMYQPEFGSVVIGDFMPIHAQPMFPPFGELAILFKSGDKDKYLANYRAELRRFWFIMGCLTIALSVSLIHLGKLISANLRLHRKKNDFISSITHELKAPLTSIIMYTEMLEEGWAKGKEATYYRYIHCESERLARLIKNILDYSGLERGVFRLKKGSLLLHSFIEETLEPLKLWIETNGLKLELKVLSTPFVNMDKDSLSQVIYNLCDNAIKYGRTAESPTLTIVVDETKTHASLLIYDNGPGVSRQEETKVFRKFYRCQNEMTRESTGTGLGLALVKELIEGNGGTVTVYRPETGTGFGVKILIPKIIMDAALVSRN